MPYKNPVLQREYQRDRCARIRREWIKKNGPCQICRSTTDLEVDHRDPSTKKGHRVWSWSETKRTQELKKCQVLCRICHQKKSADEKRKPLVHGEERGYDKGCRCLRCKAAHSLRMAIWRASRSTERLKNA
jgi:5-methylcytosine-specific restriction endonuclease McrA